MNATNQPRERGQILVLFSLSLVAMIAMVGLVLDGGAAFAQRRAEQNAADVAALAAANDLIVNGGDANWKQTALTIAGENGYIDGVGGASVQVSCVNCPGPDSADQRWDDAVDGVQVTVNVTAPHRNNFASIVGMSYWDVSTTATSKTGWVNTAHGPGPFIVSTNAFDPATRLPTTCTPALPCDLSHPRDAIPSLPTDFAWTDFGYDLTCPLPDGLDTGNVDDQDLQDYMARRSDFYITLQFGCYVAQHNSGAMTNIVREIRDSAPITFPVPIVDEAGLYVGWASFVVTDARALGDASTISGYFETGAQNEQLDVDGAGFGTSTYGGNYDIQLIN